MTRDNTGSERRWERYLQGEMSRAEAEVFERDNALSAPPELAAAGSGQVEAEARAALLRLDAVEAARRRPLAHGWDRVPVWRRRPMWALGALALAAAAVLVVVFGGTGEEEGAGPDPRVVAPADVSPTRPPESRLAKIDRDTEVRAEAADVIGGDAAVEADLGPQLAATGVDGGGDTQAAPRFVDNGVIGARSGAPLTITLATTPLGLGPEARSRRAQLKQPLQRVVVAAAPHMERLVTSGLLDAVITCVDERGRAGRLRLRLKDGATSAALSASGNLREVAACISTQAFDASAWSGIDARFVISIEDSPPPPKPPPGKGGP